MTLSLLTADQTMLMVLAGSHAQGPAGLAKQGANGMNGGTATLIAASRVSD